MTDKELRLYDTWITEHVMGCRLVDMLRDLKDFTFLKSDDSGILLLLPRSKKLIPFSPTTEPAAAMMVLEKCAEKHGTQINILKQDGKWVVWQQGFSSYKEDYAAETLPTAIVRFAKQLFSK
jgi:hypothetical protein